MARSNRKGGRDLTVEGTIAYVDRRGRGVMELQPPFANSDVTVGRANTRVFVHGALAGEHVSARYRLGDEDDASLIELHSRSADRVAPECAFVDRCGGCSCMHMSSDLQRTLKLDWVKRAIAPVNRDNIHVDWHGASARTQIRRRARLTWAPGDKGIARLGYHVRQSRHVLDVTECVILSEPLQRSLLAVRARLTAELRGTGEVHIAQNEDDSTVVWIRADLACAPSVFTACDALSRTAPIVGVALTSEAGAATAHFGELAQSMRVDDDTVVHGSYRAFSQAHDELNRAMVHTVVQAASPTNARVLELFCGVGNFTVALARAAKHVDGVELNEAAVEACQENLRRYALGNRASVRVGDANESITRRYDVVVLDPPRVGAAGAVAAISAMKHKPERVVYVSCEPRTLQRDLEILASAGFRALAAHAFDAFGPAAHVETIVELRRESV